MCNPISWWYVRSNGVGKVFISNKTDSHSEAAAEFGIKDDGLGEVCAGEFRPDYKSPSPNTSTWKLVWDYLGRTRRPAWMDDEAEASLRAALERACAKYVYTTGRHEVTSCRAFAFGDANLVVRGACHVEAYESSHVVAKSKYDDVVGRGEYDGKDYPSILRTPIEVGCTYTIKYGALVAETSNTEGDAP